MAATPPGTGPGHTRRPQTRGPGRDLVSRKERPGKYLHAFIREAVSGSTMVMPGSEARVLGESQTPPPRGAPSGETEAWGICPVAGPLPGSSVGRDRSQAAGTERSRFRPPIHGRAEAVALCAASGQSGDGFASRSQDHGACGPEPWVPPIAGDGRPFSWSSSSTR
jgi:hypothetical protein